MSRSKRSPRLSPNRNEAMLGALLKFRALVRAVRLHYRRVEQRCGVSGAYIWAMDEIGEDPDLRIGTLAERLGIHQSTASNMIDKLERRGLVSRARSEQDQRAVLLRLTASGRRALARAPAPKRGILQDALCELPARNLAQLDASLALLLVHVRGRVEAGDTLIADLVGSAARSPSRRAA